MVIELNSILELVTQSLLWAGGEEYSIFYWDGLSHLANIDMCFAEV